MKRLKLDENTLVIFASDNGLLVIVWQSRWFCALTTLREGEGTAWEGGVRVPCVMRWPGKIPAGTECGEIAATIDVLPTLAKLAGAKLPLRQIDGSDINPLLFGDSNARTRLHAETFWFYWGDALHAIRSGKWKLHFAHPYVHVVSAGQDGSPGKLSELRTPVALYDLDKDVSEAINVSAEHPEVVAKLMALAELAREDLGDSLQKRTGKNIRPCRAATPAITESN